MSRSGLATGDGEPLATNRITQTTQAMGWRHQRLGTILRGLRPNAFGQLLSPSAPKNRLRSSVADTPSMEGEASVFRVDASGKAELIARVQAVHWIKAGSE